MFKKPIMIGILLISQVTYQAAQEISILAYGSIANITCNISGGYIQNWTKPIAGGIGGIWKASHNIELEGAGIYFVSKEREIYNKGYTEIRKAARAFNIILRLRPSVLRNHNFYGAVGLVGVIPSIDHRDYLQKERINMDLDVGAGFFIGGGYKHHFSNGGIFDLQVGRMQSASPYIDFNWIVRVGVGIQVF